MVQFVQEGHVGRKKEGLALQIKDVYTCSEIQNVMGDRPVKSPWKKIKRKLNKGYITVNHEIF